MKDLLMLYNCSWDKEIADYSRGAVPSHRLFGLADLQRLGVPAKACHMPRFPRRLLSRPGAWKLYQALYAALHHRTISCVVATHEACALPLLGLKRLGLLHLPVVVINVALLHPKNLAGLKSAVWKFVLKEADAVICYASVQLDRLACEYELDTSRLFFIPFGVDTAFFTPRGVPRNDYCLSVGTNDGKDYETLIEALPEDVKLIVVTDEDNADKIRQHPKYTDAVELRHDIPIRELKELYEGAALKVIPLRDIAYSSGQTVLLENMALGKAVIVSQASMISDYVEDGNTALTVEPGNARELRDLISECLTHPQRLDQIGARAQEHARSRFSSAMFASQLSSVVTEMLERAEREQVR